MSGTLLLVGLVFARIGALFVALPVLGTSGLPRGVTVLLALVTTALVVSHLEPPTGVDLLPGMVGEIALGACAGLVVRAVFASLALAGELMGMQMGLGMAQLFDPVQKTQQGPVAMLATLLASAIFLQLDLHADLLELLVRSFEAQPPGGFAVLGLGADPLIEAVEQSLRFGLQLASPVVVLVCLINVLVGILGKLAPRMNVFFSVGPTLTTIGGIGLLAVSLPGVLHGHAAVLREALALVRRLWS